MAGQGDRTTAFCALAAQALRVTELCWLDGLSETDAESLVGLSPRSHGPVTIICCFILYILAAMHNIAIMIQ